MKILRTVSLLAFIGLALAACLENPVAEDREEVTRIQLNPVFVNLTAGGAAKKISGYTVNKYGEQTFDNVTVTACDAKVTFAEDTTRLPVEPPAKVMASGVTAGTSCLVFSGAGVSDTVQVRVQ